MELGVASLRNEERFMILSENLPGFLTAIQAVLQRKDFSKNHVTRTIYFNNEDYPVPWGNTIKARSYLPDFSREICLDLAATCRLEIKSAETGALKSKIQKELSLAQASPFISSVLGLDLQPYVVDEYLRYHFVSQDNPELFRVTIDQGTGYGFFDNGSSSATWVGDEDFARIELKVAPGYQDSSDYRKVAEIIANHKLMPVISKREHAFSFVGLVIDKRGSHPPKKETKDCEIEAKFLVRHPNPAKLLLDLKKHLQQGSTDYEVASHYPYTQEGASINHYWSRQDQEGQLKEGLKLMFIGRKVKPVLKQQTRVLPDPYGLRCILERQEVKEEPFLYTPESFNKYLAQAGKSLGKLDYVGYLLRSRRAFWPENKKSKRIFHISLDKCEALGGKVAEWQLEIEYTGRYSEYVATGMDIKKVKAAISREVAELSKIVLSFCNREGRHLTPSTLTKFDWLRSV